MGARRGKGKRDGPTPHRPLGPLHHPPLQGASARTSAPVPELDGHGGPGPVHALPPQVGSKDAGGPGQGRPSYAVRAGASQLLGRHGQGAAAEVPVIHVQVLILDLDAHLSQHLAHLDPDGLQVALQDEDELGSTAPTGPHPVITGSGAALDGERPAGGQDRRQRQRGDESERRWVHGMGPPGKACGTHLLLPPITLQRSGVAAEGDALSVSPTLSSQRVHRGPGRPRPGRG